MTDYSKVYDQEFFEDRNASTHYAAGRILDIITGLLPHITSAVDVGCGVGTWLSVLKERGVNEMRGFDGHWVNRDLLQIPADSFCEADLQQSVVADRRFDLAISLEVAEHLPASCADTFVDSLTGLSDFILFSAAIPNQGGVNHLNEQWQSYWAEKFRDREFEAIDCVRSQIWSDRQISIPYRQNIILYVVRSRVSETDASVSEVSSLSIAHPELYELRNSKSVRQSLNDLRMTTASKLSRMFGRTQSRPPHTHDEN